MYFHIFWIQMAAVKYSDEELNYFRVCKVTTQIIPDGLRQVFKKEWDTQHKATHGQWQDTAKNGIDFYGMESPKNKKMKSRELSIMKNGNTNEWDCTCLFHGILYSDSIKPTLNATVKKNIDELREFRNKAFAHTTDGKLAEADFKTSINEVITSFTALKLDTTEIEEIKNQISFPTKELEDIKKQLEKEKKRNEEPRPFSVLPPKPSHETVSRLNEVEEIKKEMERLRNTKKNEVTVVYLSGNPGCGKSEVARQIGERFFDEKITEMNFVMTVNASTIDTLLQSYVEFADRVKCDEEFVTKIKISEGRSTEEKLRDLKCRIVPRLQRYSSWLIVVDNVSDLKSVSKYWPQAGEKTSGVGQILVTTQDSSSIPSDPHTYHVSLKRGMNPDDAVKALSDISGLSHQNDITLQVAKALDFQPLALACAAVYMKGIKGTDWAKYLQKLEEGKREATEKEYQKTSLTYQKTMTAAVRMVVEKETNKDDKVMSLAFEFLSVIAAEPIPLQYVVQYVMNCLPDEDEDLVASTISSSSLVLSSEDDELEEVRVHQVVHSCLQVVILNKEKKFDVHIIWNVILAFSGIKELDLGYIPNVVATRRLLEHFTTLSLVIQRYMEFLRDDLLNHFIQKHVDVSNCISKIREICCIHGRYEAADILFRIQLIIVENLCDEKDPGLPVLLNDIGENFYYLGNYREAMKYLKRALDIEENTYGERHFTIIATLNNIGKTLCKLRRYDESMKYVERALSIQKRVYEEKHPLWARTLGIQGTIFQSMGNLKQAKLCYEKTLAIEESEHGRKRRTELHVTLSNMGCLLRELGQLKESTQYLERAIEITESVCDEKHPAFAALLRNFGDTYSEQGQFQAAISYFQRALDIENRKYGEDKHPDQASTLSGIGACLLTLGKYEESKMFFERELAIVEKVYDMSHPSLIRTMHSLACTLIGLNQYKEANSILERVLERQECSFEDKDPDFPVRLYNNLATTLSQMQQYQESKSYLDRALAVQERCNNLPPATLALTFNNLGMQERNFGRYAKAVDYFNRAVAIKEKISPSHPDLGVMLSNRGEAFFLLGKYEEATASLERALTIQERFYDKQHPEQATTLQKLRKTSIRMQKYEEAKAYFDKALSIQESCYGKLHPEVADTLCELGETLFNSKLYEESTIYFERALSIKESCYGKLHPEVANLLCRLGENLFSLKQYKEGTTYYERALSIKESYYGKEHSENAPILHSLGAGYLGQEQYEQAVELLEKSYAIAGSFPYEEYPLLANTVYCLGISYLELKQYKEAKIHLEKALEMEKKGPGGENSGLVAGIQDKLAIAIREEKKHEKKEKREQRQQQKQQRRDQHKQKYVNKRK